MEAAVTASPPPSLPPWALPASLQLQQSLHSPGANSAPEGDTLVPFEDTDNFITATSGPKSTQPDTAAAQ